MTEFGGRVVLVLWSFRAFFVKRRVQSVESRGAIACFRGLRWYVRSDYTLMVLPQGEESRIDGAEGGPWGRGRCSSAAIDSHNY